MPRSLRPLLPALALALAVLPTATAHATTMVPRRVEDLARVSESVVRATTVSTHSAWDAQKRIVTTVRLRALETLAGDIRVGEEFDLQHFGGIVDGTEMTIIGGPHFTPGQEVVVFLIRDAIGRREVADLAQGKLEVIRDAAGRERLTHRDLSGVDWFRGTGPDHVATLDELRARVAGALHGNR
ncbi:MAG: hypothetical protein HYR74_08050 [Candidatus Eisenbacteria bacterium]|nr:hypothetical protein [Candidatus Eisenbacteria bacterium]